MSKYILSWVVLMLLFYSCRSTRKQSVTPYNKMNRESILKIPFEFKSDELIGLIDSLLPDTLLEKDSDLPVSIKITKGSISKIYLDGKNINLVISVNIELEKKIGALSIASGNGEIELDIYSQIDIDEDWRLKTKTSLVEYNWIRKPEIKLIGINFNAPDIIEQYIDYKQSDWMNQIDSTIAKSDLLREPIDSISNHFSSPFKFDSLSNFGLKIIPNIISLSPFVTNENTIKGALGIKFNNDIIHLDDLNINDTVYPKFSWDYYDKFKQKAVITLSLNEREAQDLVDDFYATQDSSIRIFNIKGNNIKIKKLNIVFDTDKVGANINFTGDKAGKLLIKTRPIWDNKAKYLNLRQRFVDIKLDGFGSSLIIKLFHKTIQKKIMDSLEKTLNAKIKNAFMNSNKELQNLKYKNSLIILNYDIPMQLEDGFFMIDIDFTISGEIMWNNLNITLK